MKISPKSNIYEAEFEHIAQQYASHVEGVLSPTVVVLASTPLSESARNALCASCDKLGLDAPSITWITTGGSFTAGGSSLTGKEVVLLVEAFDPQCVIAADSTAASLMSQGYNTVVPLNALTRVLGLPVAAFSSFEGCLTSPSKKQNAWALLKKLTV